MSVTTVQIFGTNREGVNEWTSNATETCQKRGVNYQGPRPCRHVSHKHVEVKLNPEYSGDIDLPEWFDELELLPGERDNLQSALESDSTYSVFGRQIKIYDDNSVSTILDSETPENVFLRVSVGKAETPDSNGNSPSSYDPNMDYVTDLDYNAHHGN